MLYNQKYQDTSFLKKKIEDTVDGVICLTKDKTSNWPEYTRYKNKTVNG
jgi:hypothetical protein